MRRLFWATIGVALISMVFANCKKDEPTYMVQVTAAEGGTVEGQKGEYKEGEEVVFKAIPNEGYYFSKWSDGSTDNPHTIKVGTHAITIIAKFFGISATEGGTVEVQDEIIMAIPSEGYYFSQWSDGKTDNPRNVKDFTKDIILEAIFAQNPLITITASSNGSVIGPDNGYYAPGDSLSFTAISSETGYFIRWSDGNIDNPRTIIVGTSDITHTAIFAPIETVDLGLESGNLWATCNVGAVNPWNYGGYYAWGETETKDNYSTETYKYCNGTEKTLTKYNNDAEYGIVDNKTNLEPVDDVATAVFGIKYSMPTEDDWKELFFQCYWVWTDNYNNQNASGYIVYRAKADSDKGVKIYRDSTPSALYSSGKAHIFLPAAGYHGGSDIFHRPYYGNYWSSSLDEKYPSTAWNCWFCDHGVNPAYGDPRVCGFSVRPIKRP